MNLWMRMLRNCLYAVPGGKSTIQAVRRWRWCRQADAAGLRLSWRQDAGRAVMAFSRGTAELLINPAHVTYIDDIIAEFDTYYGAIRPVPHGPMLVADYASPAWHQLARSGARLYLPSFVEGEALTELYLAHAGQLTGATIIDLGANCGLASLAFASAAGPAGRVIALEPDPLNFDALQRNLATHEATNIVALKEGIWHQSGTLGFEADGSMGALVAHGPGTGRAPRITITVTTLDDLASRLDLACIDLVKMDIETAERHVVPSLDPFLRRFRPHWLIEAHDAETAALITAYFQRHDYHVAPVSQSAGHKFPLLSCQPSPTGAPD